MNIYTRRGDGGETSCFAGERIKKCDCRIESVGSIDELNSILGLVYATINETDEATKEIKQIIERLQHDLFTIGAELTMLSGQANEVHMPKITEQHIADIEHFIDDITNKLPEQRSFILPGGTQLSAWLHFARTVTRRAERNVVNLHEHLPINPFLLKYLNRLSDLFHVLARYANKEVKEQQPMYKYFDQRTE
ncbi:cob(I)yrinic acid a,c-diamide adenosyltransferase [Candidatus Woesearchaeota archaeon]|nr:cob(I)yrinic acid a,c-diamide adenosyltransferase [Candidatus Woesearchaeota archaeon]